MMVSSSGAVGAGQGTNMTQPHDRLSEMGRSRLPLARLRAGLLVLVALGLISFMVGRWTATLLSLGLLWASVIGVVVALAIALILSRLARLAYFALAGAVTFLVAFAVYDFARGPVDLSQGLALLLALIPVALLGLAFWDFRELMGEFRSWVGKRL